MAYLQDASSFLEYRGVEMSSFSYADQNTLFDSSYWDANMDPMAQRLDMRDAVAWDEEPMQRFLQESDKLLFNSAHVHDFHHQPFHLVANRPYDALEALPRAMTADSPLSSFEQLSDCSTTSPGQDNEWHMGSQQSSNSASLSYPCNVNDQFWPTASNQPQQQHISMNIIQSFEDCQDLFPEEVAAEDCKLNLIYMHDSGVTKTPYIKSCRHITEEQPSTSVKTESVSNCDDTIVVKAEVKNEDEQDADAGADADAHADSDTDVYAEAEIEDEITVEAIEDPVDDEEYSPHSRRSSKRKRTTRPTPPSPASKKSKSTQKSPRINSKSPFSCKDCNHTAKDTQSLTRHIAAQHTRPFVCTFAFAGCSGTFGSKNEWKRHVASQHLALQYWRCEEGTCGEGKSRGLHDTNNIKSSQRPGPEFNRKDLFTQHLRRMHAPFAVKRQKKTNPQWEARVKHLQSTSLKIRRQPPQEARCPVKSCERVFEGSQCWDERMEHVGKHLESAAADAKKFGKEPMVVENGEEGLRIWALQEGIVEEVLGGAVKLVVPGAVAGSVDGDEDAEGEEE